MTAKTKNKQAKTPLTDQDKNPDKLTESNVEVMSHEPTAMSDGLNEAETIPAESDAQPDASLANASSETVPRAEESELSKPISGQTPSTSYEVCLVDINLVEPNPSQPRKRFEPGQLEQLKNAIIASQYIEPILVRRDHQKPGHYIIVDGERRWRSYKDLGRAQIPCHDITDGSLDYETIAFIQNVHRQDLSAAEKAIALTKRYQQFQEQDINFQQKDLVKMVSLSESYVSELLKIGTLGDEILNEAVKSDSWTYSKLLKLAKIKKPDPRKQKFLEFKDTIDRNLNNKTSDHTGDENPKGDDPQADHQPASKTVSFEAIQKRFKSIEKFAGKIKKTDLDASQIDEIKPTLAKVQEMINEILS
jgi:ParB/RepB/Spo0J family partition protein